MKNRFSVVLIVLSLLVALVGVAAAPKAPGAVTLIGAGYVEGKGVVFTFHITGNVSKSDMKGSVHVDGGGNFGLDCVKVDSETVKCTAPKGVAGHDVTVTWGGSTFWTHVAGIPDPQAEYCYGVWSWWTAEELENGWTDFGPHCQDTPAQNGDPITYTVPAGTYTGQEGTLEEEVFFFEDPSDCEWLPNHGSAYYFDMCGW